MIDKWTDLTLAAIAVLVLAITASAAASPKPPQTADNPTFSAYLETVADLAGLLPPAAASGDA